MKIGVFAHIYHEFSVTNLVLPHQMWYNNRRQSKRSPLGNKSI